MTQRQFDKLIDSLNHKVSHIHDEDHILKTNIKYTTKIIGYMAVLLTMIFVAMITSFLLP